MDIAFPARDQSMSRMIGDLSEADAGKAADNFVTNEDSFARVATELERVTPKNGVYLGVGPDQNFTYIARTRPRLAFLLDFRRRNALLHLIHKALFTLSTNRADYLARLLARTPKALPADPSSDELADAFEGASFDRDRLEVTIARVADQLRPFNLVADSEWAEVATIQAKLAGPGLNARFLALPMYPTFGRLIRARDLQNHPAHFLAEDAWFQSVKDRQQGDRVIPLTGDFAGPHALPALGAWLRDRGLSVSVFYASDVEFFLLRAGRLAAYAANLAKIPWKEAAVLIRTSTREIQHPERIAGDSSTTILRPVAEFLEQVQAGRIRTLDDLFR